jgi:hypothetical protein
MSQETTETNNPSENGQSKVICSTELLDAEKHDYLMFQFDNDEPVFICPIENGKRVGFHIENKPDSGKLIFKSNGKQLSIFIKSNEIDKQ